MNNNFSSNTFTAPITGKYSIQGMIGITNAQAGGNIIIYLQISNAEIAAHRQNSASATEGTYETAPFSMVVDMDANDTAKLQIKSSVDTDFIVDGSLYRSVFSGHLVA